jgi:probable HAF family extracellular repeat protein
MHFRTAVLVGVLALIASVLATAGSAGATTYYQATSVSDPGNDDGVWGLFVSPGGSVVSNSDLDAEVGTTYSFVWSSGTLGSPTDDIGCWSQCDTEVTGINGSDQISGFFDASGPDQAFREDLTTQTFKVLPANSEAYGINAAGQMVGGYRNASGQERAFLWDGTTMQDLGTLGGQQALATASSATGQAVGCAQTSSGAWHPFLYQDGVMHDLGLPPGLSQACAYSVNQHGWIVGGDDVGPWTYAGPGRFNGPVPVVGAHACHAWVRDGAGTYTTIHPPAGGSCIVANHIALNDQVIGSSGGPFTWQDGTLARITKANVPFDQYIVTPPGNDFTTGFLTQLDAGWGNNLYGQLAVSATDFDAREEFDGALALLLTPITVDDENSAAITYSGAWSRIASSGAFGGFVNQSGAAGATARLTFRGKSLSVIGPKGPGLGSATIYLDGPQVATANEAAVTAQNRKRVFQMTWPTAGKHTLKIVAAGAGFELDAITVSQH